MTLLDQVQRGVDFIEAHLDESFPLTAVSRAAAMSHWHFQRTFRALTGETLMTYVRARRLSRASTRLLEGDARILDIALDAGFETQESFTRAFKRAYGLPPGRFRDLGKTRLFLDKVRIDEVYLDHVQRGVSRAPTLIERAPVRVVGLPTDFFGIDSDKNNMAGRIPPLWAAFLPRLPELGRAGRTACYGVIRTTPDSEALSYLACADGAGPVPAGMVETEIPGGTWAVFEHRGPTALLDHTVNYVYSTWLAGSRAWRHTCGPDLEIYDERWHPTSEDSVVGYAIPVAAIA